MPDDPVFVEPPSPRDEFVDRVMRDVMRELDRRFLASIGTFKQIEYSERESAASRRLAREAFVSVLWPWYMPSIVD